MSHVIFGNSRLIPAPLVEFQKSYQTDSAGIRLGSLWNLTITGTLVWFKGSPNSSGVFYTGTGFPSDENISDENAKLGVIFRKQEAIRELFANTGMSLEFQSENATAPVRCNPRITGITFSSDIWVQRSDYVITCEADVLYIDGAPYGDNEDNFSEKISSASEEWSIETNDEQVESLSLPRTYVLTHNISAVGKTFFEADSSLPKLAWEQARDWVLPKLGFDATKILSSGVRDLPDFYSGFNNVRGETIDVAGGSYSITERFILASGTALEQFEISTNTSIDSALTTVEINGTITGLETRNSNMTLLTTRYNNAATKFTQVSGLALTRAQSYAGISLNILPTNTVVGRNPNTGIISYSMGYDNRPQNLVPGSKSEVISLNDALGTDVVAIIPVLGRRRGPVLQNMFTSKERRRTLDIEVVMPIVDFTSIQDAMLNQKPSVSTLSSGAIQQIVDAVDPANAGATKSFLDENNERWIPRESRYSMTKTWVWE